MMKSAQQPKMQYPKLSPPPIRTPSPGHSRSSADAGLIDDTFADIDPIVKIKANHPSPTVAPPMNETLFGKDSNMVWEDPDEDVAACPPSPDVSSPEESVDLDLHTVASGMETSDDPATPRLAVEPPPQLVHEGLDGQAVIESPILHKMDAHLNIYSDLYTRQDTKIDRVITRIDSMSGHNSAIDAKLKEILVLLQAF
eukprot:CAMPEP_0182870606 /NCGR_PEP_ID=MMETSP0034_2-20130328/10631_1 /TAXON_ID=156128 /ORGANISM="Nephroselmis pyriformis, Strain CCMP717" /LENGTH=197 /DNA_ID=CAMNT_0025003113 /DNA_START=25 /DNA_END=615 /DNA_ORIENTATION=-